MDNADDIAAVIALAHAMHAESNFRDLTFCPETFARRLAGYMQQDFKLAAVAESDDGHIIGGVLGTAARSDFGPDFIAMDGGIYVAPTRRGAWAGKILVHFYTAWAQSVGAKRICIDVKTGVNPERTAQLLEHCGYQVIGSCLVYQE
ncbi:MAG: GNAT family N-acetyltransferase [Pseudomonadota bacterium]